MFCLKALRKEHGLKRSELANATGIHPSTLANYENGTREAPYEILILLADYFHVSVDELLGRDIPPFLPSDEPNFSSNETILIKKYRSLSDRDKERLEDYISLLLHNR